MSNPENPPTKLEQREKVPPTDGHLGYDEAFDQPAHIRPTVFWPALIFLGAVVAISIAFPTQTGNALGSALNAVVSTLGWYYTLIVTGFVVFVIWVGVSNYGDLRLGPDEEKAQYGFLTWFSMLFAAGMGIGLVFWGAAEPLTFLGKPKPGVEGEPTELAHAAMEQSFLHWGLHAWAIYVVVGLALAWAIHRKGRSISLRWTLEPIFGDRVKGKIGDAIDVVAIVGTVAGVATSLGFGVSQVAAGLIHLDIVEADADGAAPTWVLIALIIGITALATISVVSGLDKGIKFLSNVNLSLAGVFALAILLLGPTLFVMRSLVENIGGYLAGVVPMSFDTTAMFGSEGVNWQATWTMFYWGWWMSWAPFVGLFIARISRGRTVREFVFGVLLVPTLVSMIWFSILGGTALHRELFGEGGLIDGNGDVDAPSALFGLLEGLPAGTGTIMAGVAIVLVTIFFVTSSDSGSLVVDMLASGGHPEPPTWSRVLWSFIEGAVAIGLLLAGGLAALQTGAILTAVPFSVVMILMCVALTREFNREHREISRLARRARLAALENEVGQAVTTDLVENFDEHFGDQVDQRVERGVEAHAENGSVTLNNGDGPRA